MGIVRCLNCNMILESTYRHDFQQCNCENETFVDGGNNYLRYGGIDIDLVEPLDEVNLALTKAGRKQKESEKC